MINNLHLIYESTLLKYRKFKGRFDKNLKSGHFKELSSKKRQLVITRLEKLKRRLQNIKLQIRLALASGALALCLSTTNANAQLGPFVENKQGNPLRPSPSPKSNHHPALVDIDADGDLDVFIGTTFGSIIFLRNTGTATEPFFVKQTYANPLSGIYYTGVTPTFVDLDKDGDYDVVLGHQYVYQFSPYPNLIFLENTGTAASPIFSPPSGEHPIDDIFADAYYSHAAFVDIDNDGDLDAFIGSNLINGLGYEYREAIKFWRNDGSLPVAQFDAESRASNPIAVANKEFGGTVDRAAPSLVDIDGDGDFDMFVGDMNRTVRFFQNTGTASSPVFAAESTGASNPLYGFIFVNNASPEFADLDNDGDFDAIIGGDYDKIRFFENTGDATNPIFTERFDSSNPFGGLSRGNINPNAAAPIAPVAVDVDGDGFKDIVIGSDNDRDILYFKNNQDGTFSQKFGAENMFEGLLASNDTQPKPAVVDIDADGDLDLFVALYSYSGPGYGHVKFFRNDGSNNLILESTPITKNVNYSTYTLTMDDFDQDGDYDAILGSYGANGTNANFIFIKNNGTAAVPNFVEQPESGPPFNGAEIQIGETTRPRPMMVDLDHDGDMDVASGTFDYSVTAGLVSFFLNDGTDNLILQTAANNPFDNLGSSRNSHPFFIDVDNDGDLDFLIGNKYGQVAFFENTNLAPQVNTNTSTTSFNEGSGPIVLDGTLTLSDDGTDDIIGASIIITNVISSEDVLSFSPQFGITGSFDNVTGLLSLSGYAKLAEYELVLQSVTYQNTSVNPNTTTRTIEFSVTDFDNTNPYLDSFPEPIIGVNIISNNSTPIVNASASATAIYIENSTPGVIVDGAVTVADSDNTNLVGATISLITNFTQGEDVLEFIDQNGITGSYNTTSGVLTLSGNTTLSNYQIALRSIRYSNSSDNPNISDRTVEFTISDGIDTSAPTTRIVKVVAVNDAPVLSSSSTGALNYNQNTSAVIVDDLLSISDLDNANLQSVTVTITSYQSGDLLTITPPPATTSNFDNGNGILTVSGSATLAEYQTAIRTVAFSSSNGAGTRTITFIGNDGDDDSNTYNRQITISNPSTIPPIVNTTPGTTQVGSTIVIDLCNIISDPDNSFEELTITVISILSQASTNVNTCDLTIDYSAVDFEGEDSIVLRATDPDGNTAENTLIITVEPVGTEPEILPIKIFNAISPNGDGLNDWWQIENLLTPNKIELYNRWGDHVKTLINFTHEENNTALNDIPAGTYFYKIEGINGKYTGYITIKK